MLSNSFYYLHIFVDIVSRPTPFGIVSPNPFYPDPYYILNLFILTIGDTDLVDHTRS